MSVLADFLIRYRLPLLAFALLLLAAAFPVARQLAFDRSIESLYAKDDPHLLNYLESKRWFGGDEFVIVAWEDPGLFAPESRPDSPLLSKEFDEGLRDFAARLSAVPGVNPRMTHHLGDALFPRNLPEGILKMFGLRRQTMLELAQGMLVGEDNKTTAIVLRLLPLEESKIPRAQTFEDIRRLAAEHDPPAVVVGEPVQIHDMFRYVDEDGRTLFYWSLALLSIVIFSLFRSLRWLILPLLVVSATILWTDALLVLTGLRLSMVSSMLNSLVTIICVATVTHVTIQFREHRRQHDRTDALRLTLLELGPAIFWTCATTAAGFAALLISSITPVFSFGLMMSLATLLVLVSTSSILPGGILLGRWESRPGSAPGEGLLVSLLRRTSAVLEGHPVLVGCAALALSAFAALGVFRLRVETDFSKNFRKSSSIVQALNFVEEQLGGAGTWEVNFPAPDLDDDPAATKAYLAKVRRLSERLKQLQTPEGEPALTKVVVINDGLSLFSVLSDVQWALGILDRAQPDYTPTLYNRESGRMRIVLRARERQSAENKLQTIAAVERTAREDFPDARAAGLFVLLAYLIESLLSDQLASFLLAAGGIGLMMIIAFRSVKLGLISLVPNLFPIVLVIGTMGWIGLPVNIATAMIASVSMGLTVDSSIHYLSMYQRKRRAGMTVSRALRDAQEHVGLALVFANLALIVGFSVLTRSHFIPLIYFGVLVSVAMLGGLLGNLILLPLLVRMCERDESSLPAASR